MNATPLDPAALRRAFERAAVSYDAHAVPQREVCRRLLARLDYIKCEPRLIVDVGAGTGQAALALARRFRRARVVALDLSRNMLREVGRHRGWRRRPQLVCADAERLPLADSSVDLLVSASTFQWCSDYSRLFGEIRRVLSERGLLLFSSFGPDTLRELREAWSRVDAGVHVHDFVDMHLLGDAMLGAGLSDPVVDAEWLRVDYADVETLMRDLKAIGAGNASRQRAGGLRGRSVLAALRHSYPRVAGERSVSATYEVIYGHAWSAARGAPGERRVAFGAPADGPRSA